MIGCDQNDVPESRIEKALVPAGPEAEQQSPNARILPEPLVEPGNQSDLDNGDFATFDADDPAQRRPRVKPRPLPLTRPVVEEPLSARAELGYQIEAHFVWNDTPRTFAFQNEKVPAWPSLDIEVVKERGNRPALMRWVLRGFSYVLPPETELRSRADRTGVLVVWPDQRSYRVAQSGSLRSLLSDRRVDRLPYVDAKSRAAGKGTRLGYPTLRILFDTPLGTVEMETVEFSDLPYGSQLLCRQLLELVRVAPDEKVCAPSVLPVRLVASWASGGGMVFEVGRISAVQRLALEHFSIPPKLPIFKRGELPPLQSPLLPPDMSAALLPLKGRDEALAPEPVVAPKQEGEPDERPLDVAERLPADVLSLKNDTDRPLTVFLGAAPALLMMPGHHEKLRVQARPIRLVARDFLGEISVTHAALQAPVEVTLEMPAPTAGAPTD
jgi:hypothetical protein